MISFPLLDYSGMTQLSPPQSLHPDTVPLTSWNTDKASRTRLPLLSVSLLLILTGCQTLPAQKSRPAAQAVTLGKTTASDIQTRPERFGLAGKIGVRIHQADGSLQAGSAFYEWVQDGERFSLNLQGILGIGQTRIDYDGQQATLVSARAGQLQAASPEELLQQATGGWTAPLALLPDWVFGLPHQPQTAQVIYSVEGQTHTIAEQGWLGTFEYQTDPSWRGKPSRITLTRPSPFQNGKTDQVILTIQQRNE